MPVEVEDLDLLSKLDPLRPDVVAQHQRPRSLAVKGADDRIVEGGRWWSARRPPCPGVDVHDARPGVVDPDGVPRVSLVDADGSERRTALRGDHAGEAGVDDERRMRAEGRRSVSPDVASAASLVLCPVCRRTRPSPGCSEHRPRRLYVFGARYAPSFALCADLAVAEVFLAPRDRLGAVSVRGKITA